MGAQRKMERERELPSERELVARARAGDAAAFEGIFGLHGEALLRVALGVLGHADDAEDALGEVILRVMSGFARFDPARPLLPWLRRIMINECFSRIRRRRRAQRLQPDPPTAEAPAHVDGERREAIRRVRKALEALSPRQRIAMTLSGLDGMSLDDTADAMGCSVGAVKSHLHRARAKMRAQLQDLLLPEEADA